MIKAKKKQVKSMISTRNKTSLSIEEKFLKLAEESTRINEKLSELSSDSLRSEVSATTKSTTQVESLTYENVHDINPLYIVIQSKAILNSANTVAIHNKKMNSSSILGKRSPSNQADNDSAKRYLANVRRDALTLIGEAEPQVGEDHMGLELSRYLNGITSSEVISKDLQFLGEEISKESHDNNILHTVLGSIYDKIENVLKKIPGSFRDAITDLSNRTKEMVDSVATATKQKMIELLRKILDSLYQFINWLIGAFFSLMALIKKIATERGFQMDKTTLEIDAFELEAFMVGPIQLAYPKLKTPKLTTEFSVPKPS
ncbi:MAG: hypothetical protein AB7V56_09080 [Candidatus Nitrosocosmicus sp.]